MEILGLTLDVIGKVMVAYTALRVHHRVREEHRIDKYVFAEMRREQVIGIVGITLMVIGYILELSTKL